MSNINVDNIRKAGADFSFAKTALTEVNNLEYAQELANSTNISVPSNKSFIAALSSIADLVGSKIYEEILNYIDNVGNVDVCKTQALQSMCNILGISYSTFDVIDKLPSEIRTILDIMSITPEYLLRSDKVYSALVNVLSSKILVSSSASDLSQNISPYIDIDKLDNAISICYTTQIENVLSNTTYFIDNSGQPILSTCIATSLNAYKNYIQNNHQISKRKEVYNDEILRLKTLYNIKQAFNEILEVNNIEDGLSTLDDYTKYEQEILQIEIDRRKNPPDSVISSCPANSESKYVFYREKQVQTYIDFLENMYSKFIDIDSLNLSALSSINQYDIDSNYIIVNNIESEALLKLNNNDVVSIDVEIINNCVKQLVEITQTIRELRHKIKTQAQKNCMKGTFLFISYIINEYLRDNTAKNLNYTNYSDSTTNVDLVEYIDATNYFNISTDIDEKFGLSGTNTRFWESDDALSMLVGSDNTNIFVRPPMTTSKSFAFAEEELSNFYVNVLKNKFNSTELCAELSTENLHLYKFLASIFDMGADKTFMNDKNEIIASINPSFSSKHSQQNEYLELNNILQTTISQNISNVNSIQDFKNNTLDNYQGTVNELINDCSNLDTYIRSQYQNLDEQQLKLETIRDYIHNNYDSISGKSAKDIEILNTVYEILNTSLTASTAFNNIIDNIRSSNKNCQNENVQQRSNFSVLRQAINNFEDLELGNQRQLRNAKDYVNNLISSTTSSLDISILNDNIQNIISVDFSSELSILNEDSIVCFASQDSIKTQVSNLRSEIIAFISVQTELSNNLSLLNNYVNTKFLNLSVGNIIQNISSTVTTYVSQACDIFINTFTELRNRFNEISSLEDSQILSGLSTFIEDIQTYNSEFSNNKVDLSTTANDINIINISGLSELSDYKTELYYKYTGTQVGETPYYYHSNTVHPSYQIHPYLSAFIEAYDYTYDIENLPMLAEDTMYKLLNANLSNYIDNAGYLLSIWNNPLNRNSDYLTHYERVSHLDSENIENKLFGYDGLFYPEALDDLYQNYYNNPELSTTKLLFDKLLARRGYISNWYHGLNVSKKQSERIAKQLVVFKDFIIHTGYEKWYDIYRYGKDAYGNMYILIKDYNLTSSIPNDEIKTISENVKKDIPGSLWIRLKNHPIAFPAYYFDKLTDITNKTKISFNSLETILMWNTEYSQIDYSDTTSNTVFKMMRLYDKDGNLSSAQMPLIYDFIMSKDMTQIELYGKRLISDTEEYDISALTTRANLEDLTCYNIVIANITQEYNFNVNVDRYELKLNKFSSASNNEGYLLYDSNAGIHQVFKCFTTSDDGLGAIVLEQSSQNTNSINIINYLYNISKNNRQEIKGELLSELPDDVLTTDEQYDIINTILNDSSIDVCNNVAYIAYLSAYKDTTLKTYFGSETTINYSDLSTYVDVFNKNLVIKTAEIGKYNIMVNSIEKHYLPFTDMGFLPLISQNLLKSDSPVPSIGQYAATTDMYNKYQLLKFQLISQPITQGINYVYSLPVVRMYENYKEHSTKLSSVIPNIISDYANLRVMSYRDVHYYEDTTKQLIDDDIYNPYELINALSTNENINITVKVDEKYRSELSIISNSPYLKTRMPYLLVGDIPNEFIVPGEDSTSQNPRKYAQTDNVTVFKINDHDTYPLSVQWMIQGNTIKLDFNSQYFNKSINPVLPNYYNYQHTFLNLDYPGAAGYLKVYNNNINDAQNLSDFNDSYYYDNVYYIKNISDTKPKFLLSAESLNEQKYVFTMLMANNLSSEGETEDEIIVKEIMVVDDYKTISGDVKLIDVIQV